MEPCTFRIPGVPPSVNSMYKINYRKRECYLDGDARDWKYKAKLFTPVIKYIEGTKLKVSVKYHGNWLNKDGTFKRKDGQNLDKCLYDAIFEKMGVDDKVAFKGDWEKVQDNEEYTLVTIDELL